MISRFGVGYDNVDVAAATRRGIPVTYIPDAMVDAVADLTLGSMLAVARRIPEFDRGMKAGEWPRYPAFDVCRKTLGIWGTGRIGLAVAERARGFRMTLLGHDLCRALASSRSGRRLRRAGRMLARADFLTLHLPLTPATERVVNAEMLARMKPTAFVINAARGGLVDEDALHDALAGGRLGGFATDVFRRGAARSPPPLVAPNVVVTPHVASYTDGAVTSHGPRRPEQPVHGAGGEATAVRREPGSRGGGGRGEERCHRRDIGARRKGARERLPPFAAPGNWRDMVEMDVRLTADGQRRRSSTTPPSTARRAAPARSAAHTLAEVRVLDAAARGSAPSLPESACRR